MKMDKEKLKAKIIRFAKYEAEQTGKTRQEILKTLISG